MAIIITIGLLVLILLLPVILFVSLVWIHRPDLSLLAIFLEAVAETAEIIKSKIHRDS